jgi:hypothetical protein
MFLNKQIFFNRKVLFAGFIIFLYVLSIVINLGYLPLDGEEPRRAVVSIEMLHSGNFIMPTLFGWEYINKPPVYNWLMSFLMYLFGTSSEWVVRLPSLLVVLAWAGCQYVFAKKFFPKPVAALSAFFLLTCLDLFFYTLGHGGEIEVFYSCIVYLQVVSIFYFGEQKKWILLFVCSCFFCALGFLTKGFPSLLFQFLTLLAYCFYQRSVRVMVRWQHITGLIIFAVLVGGYLYFYSFYSSPQRLLVNLLNESFKKSAVGERSQKIISKVLVYPFSFLKLLLPWSLLLLLLVKKHRFKLWDNPLVKFSVLFICFNIWVYWFTGRPILRYVYMFIPFSYNILVYIFWKFNNEFPGYLDKALKYFVAPFILALLVVLLFPVFTRAQMLTVIITGFLLLGFIIIYLKINCHKIWLLGTGLILLRLAYAAVIIPVQYEHLDPNYKRIVAEMLKANNNQPVIYWTESEELDITVDLKFWQWNLESVVTPPFIFCQFPYYHYAYTGTIMKHDINITENKTYLTHRYRLKDKEVEIIWSWYDERQENEFVLFRKKANDSVSVED